MGRLKQMCGGANVDHVNPTHCTAASDVFVSKQSVIPVRKQMILFAL